MKCYGERETFPEVHKNKKTVRIKQFKKKETEGQSSFGRNNEQNPTLRKIQPNKSAGNIISEKEIPIQRDISEN